MVKALDRKSIRNSAKYPRQPRATSAERVYRLIQAVRLLAKALLEAGRMGTPVVAKMANLAIDEAIGLVGEGTLDPTNESGDSESSLIGGQVAPRKSEVL